jgi:hypothetical protein
MFGAFASARKSNDTKDEGNAADVNGTDVDVNGTAVDVNATDVNGTAVDVNGTDTNVTGGNRSAANVSNSVTRGLSGLFGGGKSEALVQTNSGVSTTTLLDESHLRHLFVDDECLTCSVSDADADFGTHRANMRHIMNHGNEELSPSSRKIASMVVEHLLGDAHEGKSWSLSISWAMHTRVSLGR